MDWFFFQLFFGLPVPLPGPDPIDPDPGGALASPDKPENGSAESPESVG